MNKKKSLTSVDNVFCKYFEKEIILPADQHKSFVNIQKYKLSIVHVETYLMCTVTDAVTFTEGVIGYFLEEACISWELDVQNTFNGSFACMLFMFHKKSTFYIIFSAS